MGAQDSGSAAGRKKTVALGVPVFFRKSVNVAVFKIWQKGAASSQLCQETHVGC